MRPFFFGRSQAPLFGIHHPPAGGAPRRGAVVLCHPFGAEYLRAHRALRELAGRLAQAGFHVIRFDYSCCGDSAGDGEEADLPRWMDDVDAAIEEVRETSGRPAVSLVGLRLGAALATLVAIRRRDVDKLVLWDPVIEGKSYLAELRQQHVALLAGRPRPKGLTEADTAGELMGTPLPVRLREAIEGIDLLALRSGPARGVLVISSDEGPAAASLRDHLQPLASRADYEHLPGSRVWVKQDLDQSVVPPRALQFITDWLAEGRL
jgi:exosortase A-associated hydrolase 2